MSKTFLEVDAVGKCFGERSALRDVSFAVPSGQICGLLGPNCAGKTTLLRLVMGLLKPTSGRITIDGLDSFADRVATKRIVGFVPDDPVFYPYLSGRETLELSAAMHGLDVAATMKRLAPATNRLRFVDLNQSADTYSRGAKKKLALLLAGLHRPKLLVLDEPTNGLDVESTHLFFEYLREQGEAGTTVLISTHQMEDVQRLCTRVVIIDRGHLVADDATEALRAARDGKSLEDVFLELTRRQTAA